MKYISPHTGTLSSLCVDSSVIDEYNGPHVKSSSQDLKVNCMGICSPAKGIDSVVCKVVTPITVFVWFQSPVTPSANVFPPHSRVKKECLVCEAGVKKIVFSRSLTERARCVTILEWRRAVQPLNHRLRPGPSPAQPSTHRARPVKGGGQQTAEPPACSNTEHQAHRFTGVPEGILHTNSDLTDNGLGRHSLVCQANPAKRAGWLVGVDCLPRGSIVKRTVEYIYRHL